MARERAQKKSFHQILEDIKEKMKDKKTKRLSRASTCGRGRSRIISKNNETSSTNTILKGVQLNNKALALALEAEKEKLRQANVVILQLKREQQAMFLHLLLLKRRLKDQEALAASVTEQKPTDDLCGPQHSAVSKRRKRSRETLDEHILCDSSPITPDPQPLIKNQLPECEKPTTLPSTVCVRRNQDKTSRRRSERLQEQVMLSENDPGRSQVQQVADPSDAAELQHSTPEPVPAKKSQPQPCRKAQQQSRPKSESAQRKPERGRKPERAPLKKPWENPKPRARSKSRDRSAKRAKAAPQSQNNKLNTSLGFNDTFDFDCEETVHVTPFRAKAEDAQPSSPINEEASQREEAQAEASSAVSKQSECNSSSPSSESEDSLYVPHMTRRTQSSPHRTESITTRRGRLSRGVRLKENIPPKQQITIYKDEDSILEAAVTDKGEGLPDSSSPIGSDQVEPEQNRDRELLEKELKEDRLPPVSPLVEAEMMRIDSVLSNFGDYPSEASALPPHQTPQRFKMCKKGGLGVRTAGKGLSLCDVTNLSPAAGHKLTRSGSHSSDARCSTPVLSRRRRNTMAVNYKEPSLSAKLRRGDKFTDLQFLCSPIFKDKPGRRSVQSSRKTTGSQKPLDKYNESFVGCR